MLVDATVLYLVHGVELSLEQNKLASSWGILVEQALLEFLKSVNNLEEVAVVEEEAVILEGSLLYNIKMLGKGELL